MEAGGRYPAWPGGFGAPIVLEANVGGGWDCSMGDRQLDVASSGRMLSPAHLLLPGPKPGISELGARAVSKALFS